MITLISEKNIKEFSLLDDNLSFDYILPTLRFVQDEKLTRILGRELYTDIQNSVKENDISEEYKYLLDNYIKYILLWGIMAHIQVPLNYKFRNQGMTNTSNEDGSNQFLSEIKYTKEFYANTGSFYEGQLYDYLFANRSKYPLWKCIEKTWNSPITL